MNIPTPATSALPQQMLQRLKWQLALEYFGFSIIPVLSFAVIPDQYDIVVLIAVFAAAFPIVWSRVNSSQWKEWSWHKFGFRLDNVRKIVIWYVLCAVIGFITIVYCKKQPLSKYDPDYGAYLAYSIIGSPLQEFLYRVYLLKLGEDLFGSKIVNFACNVLLFTGMHWFFPNTDLVLKLVFAGGILFTGLYMVSEYRNFLLICIVHILLNATAIKAGIFKKQEETRQYASFFVC